MAAAILAAEKNCLAHGLTTYLSTPVTPPAGMEWLRTAALVGLSLAGAMSLRIVWRYSYAFAASAGAAAAIMFSLVFYMTGRFATHGDTAQGLGSPYQPMFGLSWSEVGSQFVIWNGLGLFQFITIIVVIGMVSQKLRTMSYAVPLVLYTAAVTAAMPWISYYALYRGSAYIIVATTVALALLLKRSRIALIVAGLLALLLPDYFAVFFIYSLLFFPVLEAATREVCLPNRLEIVCAALTCAFVYFMACMPFVTERALAHGWGGVYFQQRCENQLKAYAGALKSYAAANDGFTPNAKNLGELVERLKPYGKSTAWYDPGMEAALHCPLSVPFEREPAGYDWDASCANQPLEKLQHFPVRCTYEKCRSCGNEMFLDKGFINRK